MRLLTGHTAWRTHAIESIGLRSMGVSDGPVGVRGTGEIPGASSALMPAPSALAATWDLDAAARAGLLFATEARRLGVDIVLAPQVNLQRTPVGGRHFECYSEDPLLTSAIAGATVAAMQAAGVAACLKHFVANDSETARTEYVSVVDEQALREVYLAPFDYLVHEVGVWSVMAAYNGVEAGGETRPDDRPRAPAHGPAQGRVGLRRRGRQRLDGHPQHRGVRQCRARPDHARPRRPVGAAPRGRGPRRRGGRSPPSTTRWRDCCCSRRALARSRRASRSPPTPVAATRADDEQFVRDLAAQSMVVLKGDGTLPIATAPASIALIGPNAVSAYVLGGGSSTVNPHHIVDPLQGLRAAYPNSAITLLRGGAARVHTPQAAPGALVSAPGRRHRSGRAGHRRPRQTAPCSPSASTPSGPAGSTTSPRRPHA